MTHTTPYPQRPKSFACLIKTVYCEGGMINKNYSIKKMFGVANAIHKPNKKNKPTRNNKMMNTNEQVATLIAKKTAEQEVKNNKVLTDGFAYNTKTVSNKERDTELKTQIAELQKQRKELTEIKTVDVVSNEVTPMIKESSGLDIAFLSDELEKDTNPVYKKMLLSSIYKKITKKLVTQ